MINAGFSGWQLQRDVYFINALLKFRKKAQISKKFILSIFDVRPYNNIFIFAHDNYHVITVIIVYIFKH